MKRKFFIAAALTVVLVCAGCSSNKGSGIVESTGAETEEATKLAETTAAETEAETPAPEETTSGEDGDNKGSGESGIPVNADDWAVISEYGFDGDGYSILSYTLHGETLQDEGDYYTLKADFAKPILRPDDPQVGEEYTITLNELTGETWTITCVSETDFTADNGADVYCSLTDAPDEMYLYEGSGDRIDCTFYQGTLCISKDAVTGQAVLQQPYTTVEESDLTQEDNWFNGLKFDENGCVTELIFFGD